MLTLDDVKAAARPVANVDATTDATLDVPANPHVAGLVDVLTQYFGEDDSRAAIRLVVGGEELGYVHREDLYALASASQKGIGSSDYAALPGRANYRLIGLRCPVVGCTHRLMVTTFDEEDPPKCTVHPAQSMEIDS
jgi:hypothetical protein